MSAERRAGGVVTSEADGAKEWEWSAWSVAGGLLSRMAVGPAGQEEAAVIPDRGWVRWAGGAREGDGPEKLDRRSGAVAVSISSPRNDAWAGEEGGGLRGLRVRCC